MSVWADIVASMDSEMDRLRPSQGAEASVCESVEPEKKVRACRKCGGVERYKNGECKACVRLYKQKPEVKEKQRLYNQKPEVKEKKRLHNQKPKAKERLRLYYQKPEVKERLRLYNQKPEVKERLRLHNQKPKAKERMRLHNQKPEAKEKARLHNQNLERRQVGYARRVEKYARNKAALANAIAIDAVDQINNQLDMETQNDEL